MKKNFLLLLSLALLSQGGCSFFKAKSSTPDVPASYVDSSQVIQRSLLQKGGKLLVEPFLAGENVYASEQVDRLALKLVQGLAKEFEESPGAFQVLSADDADKADLIMQGYFTQLLSPQPKMFGLFGNKKYVLAINGEIINPQNGELILKFTHQKEIPSGATGDLEILSLAIGQDVGKFLLSSVAQNSQRNLEGGKL
jgi:hypothetical protein